MPSLANCARYQTLPKERKESLKGGSGWRGQINTTSFSPPLSPYPALTRVLGVLFMQGIACKRSTTFMVAPKKPRCCCFGLCEDGGREGEREKAISLLPQISFFQRRNFPSFFFTPHPHPFPLLTPPPAKLSQTPSLPPFPPPKTQAHEPNGDQASYSCCVIFRSIN